MATRRPRLLAFLAGCTASACCCALLVVPGMTGHRLTDALDRELTNLMFHLRGPTAPRSTVLVVDIDEQSLQAHGQWPWPRTTVARLVRELHAAGAAVIGFDIVFAEADRTSPTACLARLPDTPELTPCREALTGLDHDRLLGDAVAAAPAVLGYAFQLTDDGLKQQGLRPFPGLMLRTVPPGRDYAALPRGYRAILNIPAVSLAPTEGFFNVFPDPAGTIRTAPLFMTMDNLPYPCLALEMARLARGIKELTLHLADDGGMLGVSLGGSFIPTDEQGRLRLNYRGPAGTFPSVSAGDILDGRERERIRGRPVIIGSSSAGLLDVHATPFSAVCPGVEIQATLLDNLLAGDPLVHDAYTTLGITFTLLLTGGIIMSLLVAGGGAALGPLAGLLLLCGLLYADYRVFLTGRIISMAAPLSGLGVVFLVTTLTGYLLTQRQRRFLESAFGHYVPQAVVRELNRHPESLTLQGQQLPLTVLFSDIRDFTAISESLPPQKLITLMNLYLDAMSDLVLDHRGTVDKYIGDAVMALWGAPLSDPDHALHAVRAALAMLTRLESLNPELSAQDLPALHIGIGINSGQATVGNFGSRRRFDYTAIGDDVNLASRLEGLTKTYGAPLIISGATRAACGDDLFCRPLDRVRVKGRQAPLDIYEPLGEGSPAPEIARETAELEKALDAYRRRDFAAAGRSFAALHRRRPCTLFSLYLARSEAFLAHPPPPDWDGSTGFTTK